MLYTNDRSKALRAFPPFSVMPPLDTSHEICKIAKAAVASLVSAFYTIARSYFGVRIIHPSILSAISN